MYSPYVLVAQAHLCLVSQGCARSLECQSTVVVSLAPRPIDRGDVGWPYWGAQKKGSTEAASVGSKSVVVALVPMYIIHYYLIFVNA